jgi:hypothetical protein
MKFRHLMPLLAAAMLPLGACQNLPPGTQEMLRQPLQPQSTAPAAQPTVTCPDGMTRKALVTAFPLLRPEQIRPGEYMGWPQATAEVLAHTLARGGRLDVSAAPQHFPFTSADAAPEVERDRQGAPVVVAWAAQENAQYVVAGVFRDFGMVRNDFLIPERHVVTEAFIYDGNDGGLLARREFSWKLPFSQDLPRKASPGTREFAATRIGQLYHALIDEIAHWTEESIACRPFPLRVTKIEGRRVHFASGGARGIAPGMGLQTWRPDAPPPARRPGELLSGNAPFATVKEVSPDGGIAEISPQRNPSLTRPGDLLYVAPRGTARNKP